MGVFVEKEFRIKRSGGGDNQRSIRASSSAITHKAKTGSKQQPAHQKVSKEVTFKITGAASTAKGIKNGVDYITREGELDAHFYDGNDTWLDGSGKEHNRDIVSALSEDNNYALKDRKGEPADHVKNMVFSPPPSVKVTKEDLLTVARKTMQHRYPKNACVLVYHDDKEKHPHVHVNVKLKREDCAKRIRLTKSELRELRTAFCKELNTLGYDVKATYKTELSIKNDLTKQSARDTYRVVDFGEAAYGFKLGQRRTPYITYETLKSGKEVTIWGKELKQHFEPEKLEKGALIKVKKLSPTTIKTPLYDKDGNISGHRETKKNNWSIENTAIERDRKVSIQKEITIENTQKQKEAQISNKISNKDNIIFAAKHGYTKQSPEHKASLKQGGIKLKPW
jgi:hypothetical protein